ncbi:hypothetical protein [Cognatiyoonia sp. IB215182]|uniref:hypothetical protein n=1 Tax=Cognatiyoonia sp. IB215182 TaxID=3097353 RepID=UPI002A0CC732|nr:hypothetical protein [Cognatiyoonia sp. IB215182]MDX8355130.1 hypothetical protein [Cognatiyoonia sp. IB215182]
MADILNQEELRTLTDIGFIAASRGLQDHAVAIFDAVKALRPEGEAGYLGLSMVDILKGNPAAAVETLKEAPQSDAVNTFLGIALVQSSDIQTGRQVLQSVINESADTPFARIASETLASVSATAAHG